MKQALCAVLLLTGCAPPASETAGRWPTPALARAAQGSELAGGFAASLFVTLEGRPLPFSSEALAGADGWSVLPAFALSQPAAYLVTELWEHHPDPWIQPVYVLVTSFDPITRQVVNGTRVPTVFGVGEDSTFYSPYWEAIFVKTRVPAPEEGLADTRAVLGAASETRIGAKPLCPITPARFGIAAAPGAGPVHPLTGAPIRQLAVSAVRIDGASASYIDLGVDRFEASESGAVTPTRIFFFTRTVAGQRTLLELPAVLSDNAVRSGYARRYDVVLDKEAIFVPAGPRWDAARGKLNAGPVDPAIPVEVAAAYALRVAKSSACFAAAANFPAGCQWLDSEAAIEGLDPRRVIRTGVTMTAAPVLFNGVKL